MTGPYTQSDHNRAAKVGGMMIVAEALLAALALAWEVVA